MKKIVSWWHRNDEGQTAETTLLTSTKGYGLRAKGEWIWEWVRGGRAANSSVGKASVVGLTTPEFKPPSWHNSCEACGLLMSPNKDEIAIQVSHNPLFLSFRLPGTFVRIQQSVKFSLQKSPKLPISRGGGSGSLSRLEGGTSHQNKKSRRQEASKLKP